MSKIEWTDKTQNPIAVFSGGHYCEKISPGCKNCYAEKMNLSSYYKWANLQPYRIREEGHPEMVLNAEMLLRWYGMRKGHKIFIGSMTDVFGEWVPDRMIYALLGSMTAAPRQTFQLLTKRPERVGQVIGSWLRSVGRGQLPANIWIGISAEDQITYDERIKWLMRCLAQVRFVSLEPLLAPIKLDYINELDWIIIGGESGPNARPLELDWIEAIIRQAQFEASPFVPVFVKQLGTRWARRAGATDKKGGDPDEWPADLRVRMFPGEVWE